MNWFRKRELTPGRCECGHIRSAHEKGKGRCTCASNKEGYVCACMIYIRAAPTQAEKEVAELKNLFKKK